MRILVVNDDSINSKGLKDLVVLAKELGEVTVVAPKFEQSAKSHAIDVVNGMELERVDLGLAVEAYSLDSTPADCVRTAVYGLGKSFDLVLSGINSGLNLGEDIFYSGTVAAATEAAMLGINAIALSTEVASSEDLVSKFALIHDFILENELLNLHNLYNINVPKAAKGIKITKQGSTHFATRFELKSNLYYQLGGPRHEKDKDNLGSDVRAIYENYISVTPLNVDRTEYSIYKKLKK